MTVSLASRDYGDGPPLVILHGLFGSAGNWTTIAKRLAESWTVHAVDLRNHGRSPWVDEMSYEAMARDVLDFLDRRAIARAVVVGHSMGGKTAMTLALMHPERVGALVVVDIAPVAYRQDFQDYVEAMKTLDPTVLTRRAEAEAQLRHVVPEPGIRSFLLQNLVSEQGRLVWRINLAALGAGMAAISAFPNELLDRVYTGRTLFLAGGLSDYIRSEHHDVIKRVFPAARIESVPGVGHWVHAEAPERFLAHTTPFLESALSPETIV